MFYELYDVLTVQNRTIKKKTYKTRTFISKNKKPVQTIHFGHPDNKNNNNNLLFLSFKYNGGPPPGEGGGTALIQLIG